MEKTISRTIKMVFAHFPLFMLMTYIIDFRDSSRLLLFIFFGFLLSGIIIYRVVLIVAIVGFNENARSIYKILTEDVAYGYQVMGYFTDEVIKPGEIDHLGALDSIENELKKGRIEELYIALTTTNASRVKNIFRTCDKYGVRVKIIPDFFHYTSSHHVDISYYNYIPVLRMRSEPLATFRNKMLKRTFDVFFALIVILTISWWLFPIVALIIKLTSKGPVLFRQKRSGIDGKLFTCYKFRTMTLNDDADQIGAEFEDSRVTPFGRFLRKSKICRS